MPGGALRLTEAELAALLAARPAMRRDAPPEPRPEPRRPASAPGAGSTEKAWQASVLSLARAAGWLAYHPFDSRRSEAGFPDLVLVRERVVFVELKSPRGRLSKAQMLWRDALCAAGAEWHCWRPVDVDAVVEALRRPPGDGLSNRFDSGTSGAGRGMKAA